MLTGRPPFLVRSIADIVARDPLLAPEPIAGWLGAPSTLDGLILSGLATDRNRRPPTALLLAQAWKQSRPRCSQPVPRDRLPRAA
jgi:eukaryotic-like serine/threonine-protein kinase